MAEAHPAGCSVLLPAPAVGWGQENTMKCSRVETRTGRARSPATATGKEQTQLGETTKFNLDNKTTTNVPIEPEQDTEKYSWVLKPASPHPCLLPGLGSPRDFSTFSPQLVERERGLQSVHQLSLPLLPLRGRTPLTLPLLHCGVCPTGHSPP